MLELLLLNQCSGMVRLHPSDVQVDVGSWATFTCNVSCDLSQSHTVKWFVGEFPHNQRQVDSGFKLRTGIDTEITDVSVCGTAVTIVQPNMEQKLHIKILSAQTMNKTAVQCAALRKGPSYQDLYSHYSMIIVNGMFVAKQCYVTRSHDNNIMYYTPVSCVRVWVGILMYDNFQSIHSVHAVTKREYQTELVRMA